MNHRVGSQTKAIKKSGTLSFNQYKLQAEILWLKGPVGDIRTDNTLLVILKDSNGALTSVPEGLTLEFYATMPSMGHPMEDAGYFENIGPGLYINQSIRYNMPGDWKNELWLLDNDFETQDRLSWEVFF
jgi:hypothetical protein